MKSNTSIKSIISMIIVISVLATGCGKGSESGLKDTGNALESVTNNNYKEDGIEYAATGKSEFSNSESNEEAGNKASSEARTNSSEDNSVDIAYDSSSAGVSKDNDDTKGASDNDKIEDTNQNKGDKSDMDSTISSEDFYISEITDELFEKMQGKSYKDDCNVPREDLRYIHILHKDLEGDEPAVPLAEQRIAEFAQQRKSIVACLRNAVDGEQSEPAEKELFRLRRFAHPVR